MRQFSGYSGNVNSIAADAGGFAYVTESSFTDSAVSVFAANSNGLSHFVARIAGAISRLVTPIGVAILP